MKNKKILIIGFIVIAVLLIGAGTVYSLFDKEPEKKDPDQEETKKPNDSKENVNEDAEKHKVAEMKSILTPDNKIRFGSATAYRSNGISGMMLNVIPYENFDRVYIKLELKLAKETETIVLYLENLIQNKQVEYEVQSLKDWTKLKSWSISIVTEAEAFDLGFVKE